MQLYDTKLQRNRNDGKSYQHQLLCNETAALLDNEFADYKDKSVQEFHFVISEGTRKQIFFTGFVQNIETQIKSKSVINAIKQAFNKHGCHL